MSSDIFTYIVINSISGVLTLLLGVYAYVKKDVFSHSKTFILMEVFALFYIFGHAIELASNTLPQISFWLKVQYIGLPFVPPLSLVLILQYTGLEKYIKRKMLALIFAVPFITFLLSMTNDFHHLLYRSLYLRPDVETALVDIIPGPWYVVHGSYTFGCMFLATCILLWYWIKTKANYWKQIVTLILGLVIPMAASFLYLIGVSPYGMDPVPIVMCVTSALYFWAIFSSKLFLLAPVARDRIFESMRDGVIVMDVSMRIIDFNQAAARIMPSLNSASIGENVHSIWKYSLNPMDHKSEWFDKENNKFYLIHTAPVYKEKQSVAGYTINMHDITEQKILETELKKLAYTDALTKIYNRAYFLEKSNEQLSFAVEAGQHLSVILFDIDHFKKVNDVYGHNVGDLAICHAAGICSDILEEEGIFARYGGEEFVICLPRKSLEEAGKTAENIRKKIDGTPLHTDKGLVSITVSLGVSEVGEDIETLDQLLNAADQALYASKDKGRNMVHLARGAELLRLEKMVELS